MKINLYYCPLCEKNRLKREKPTVWVCDACNIVIELSNLSYKEHETVPNAMGLSIGFVIVERRKAND